MAIASSSCTAEQQRFLLEARRTLLDELHSAVIDQVPLLALTGQPGAGKTTFVSALEEQLAMQAIDVLRVGCGERGSIDLRTLSCQLLGRPDTEFTSDDVEGLFDLLGTPSERGRRRVVIIDGAEHLRSDALGYLNLLSNIVGDAMPPIVFVGTPSFLEPGSGTATDLRGRVAFRRDLAPLTPEEAGQFIDLSARARSLRLAVRAALIRHADGSIDRLAALLALTESIRAEQGRRRATETTVDLAAAKLALAGVGLQVDVQPHRASARAAVLAGVAALLIVSPGSWQSEEKGVRLDTLVAMLDGRNEKTMADARPVHERPELRPIVSNGDDLLARGDIVAARLYYERAAALGNAGAATSLGKTYDPAFLAGIPTSSAPPDRDRAASWYRIAIALGDGKAASLLAHLTAESGRR